MKRNNMFQTKAQCGINVVGEVIPGAYSVSAGVWVKAGPVYETADERGISHFIEHMLFKGTQKRSAKDIAAEIDAIGGSINAFTGKECTCYYTRTLGEDLPIAIDILLDMVCNPLLADTDIENEKGVVCEEILMGEDDPEDVVHENLCINTYKNSPIGYPILGNQNSVRSITGAKIRDYMDRRYRPENIVIACAGAFSPDELVSMVNEKYTKKVLKESTPYAPANHFEKGKQTVIAQKDVEQAHICLSLPSNAFSDRFAPAVNVINSVFGGASSSWLFQNIREEKGLAYSVYSASSAYSDTGYWTLYAGTSEAKAKEVLSCMLDELKKLKRNGISREEMESTKEQLRRGFMLGLESVAAHSSTMGKDMLILGRMRDDDEILSKLASVTQEDLQEAVDMMLCGDMCLSLVCKNGDTDGTLAQMVRDFEV